MLTYKIFQGIPLPPLKIDPKNEEAEEQEHEIKVGRGVKLQQFLPKKLFVFITYQHFIGGDDGNASINSRFTSDSDAQIYLIVNDTEILNPTGKRPANVNYHKNNTEHKTRTANSLLTRPAILVVRNDEAGLFCGGLAMTVTNETAHIDPNTGGPAACL